MSGKQDLDYYSILGVGQDASADDIKAAHRHLRRQYRDDPDKTTEISLAVSVLSDPELRKEYDRSLSGAARRGQNASNRLGAPARSKAPKTEIYARGSPSVEPTSGDTEILDRAFDREPKQVPDTHILAQGREPESEQRCDDTLIVQPGQGGEDAQDLGEDPDATKPNEADNKTAVRQGGFPPPAFLEIESLDGKKEVHHLKPGKTTIGRKDDNDIVLEDPDQFISRRHVHIISRKGGYFVADCGSRNGTRLQGREIKRMGEVELNEGDMIEIEGLRLILRFEQTP